MDEFKQWLSGANIIQFDIETTGLDVIESKILSLSFGNIEQQFVFQTSKITDDELNFLLSVLQDKTKLKLIHNAIFDRSVVYSNYNIHINNVWDTYMVYRILTGGYKLNKGQGRLDSLLKEFGVELDKSVVHSFVDFYGDELTEEQIDYAANDVKYLELLYNKQIDTIEAINDYVRKFYPDFDLNNIIELEHDIQESIVSINTNRMIIDTDKWYQEESKADAIMKQAETELNDYILAHASKKQLERDGFLLTQDVWLIGPRSYQKLKRLNLTWETILAAYNANEPWLLDMGLYKPAGSLVINWASAPQRLKIFKYFIPDLVSTNKRELSNHTKKPIIKAYAKWNKAYKVWSSFGKKYIEKYGEQVSPTIIQLVRTGRMACKDPNLQQLPKSHRKCFKAPEDWRFVLTDYESQELAVIATISKDPVLLEGLKNGWDLHGIGAEIVFGEAWAQAALPNCEYMVSKQKCGCPQHKDVLRKQVKTVNFGLVYGMTEYKLSDELQITLAEARALISKYFKAFPTIKASLDSMGKFAVKNDFILTMRPYNRVRWLQEQEDTGKKERAGKNTPIQGTSADMSKLALFLIQNKIKKLGWQDKVRVVMAVHDRIDTIAHKSVVFKWAKYQQECLEEAASIILGHNYLKAPADVRDYWE